MQIIHYGRYCWIESGYIESLGYSQRARNRCRITVSKSISFLGRFILLRSIYPIGGSTTLLRICSFLSSGDCIFSFTFSFSQEQSVGFFIRTRRSRRATHTRTFPIKRCPKFYFVHSSCPIITLADRRARILVLPDMWFCVSYACWLLMIYYYDDYVPTQLFKNKFQLEYHASYPKWHPVEHLVNGKYSRWRSAPELWYPNL